MSKAVHILVSGKVQGVGYRNFARAHAEGLGLKGWVRNLADDRVEVLVDAKDPEKMKLFLQFLKEGPRRSQVEDLQVREIPFALTFDEFSVEPDGGKQWSEEN